MRVSTLSYYKNAVDSIIEQQAKTMNTQFQISTGKRINNPSDDPSGSTQMVILNKEISNLKQYVKNGDAAKSNLELTDSLLNGANNIIQRIRELAIYANNGGLTTNDRNSIVVEMETRQAELVELVNSKDMVGNYLFSGFKADTPPVLDLGGGSFQYQGDSGHRHAKVGSSTTVSMGPNAGEAFFRVSTSHVDVTQSLGQATQISPSSGLVNVSSLGTLDANELELNQVLIQDSTPDGLSSTDARGSAISISAAINASNAAHGIRAAAESNILDLGVITAGALDAGELSINGVPIIDGTGTEQSMIEAVNDQSLLTGVVATQPGGAGTALILTATDGRNIQMTTDGTSVANLGNFDLGSGALDQVQKAAVTLVDHQGFIVGGSNPSDVGFTAATVGVSANAGTAIMGAAAVVDVTASPNEHYSIVFNNPPNSFHIVADSNPNAPISGFENVEYVSGQDIAFEGLRLNISGNPVAGDVFSTRLSQGVSQDVFSTIQQLTESVRSHGGNSSRLSYEIGVALDNLSNAETSILEARSKTGANLNVLDSQHSVNQDILTLTQTNLSNIVDLDYAEAITRLSQQTMTLQAAQQSFIKIQGLSLFNFLR